MHMKSTLNKKLALIVITAVIYLPAFSQDTLHSNPSQKKDTTFTKQISPNQKYQNRKRLSTAKVQKNQGKNNMYRDTRLGSSSKLYNTYKKNNYGAGAITTNPNK